MTAPSTPSSPSHDPARPPALPCQLPLPDAEATAALARALAPRLGPGDTLLLDGPIGAGKTHFARSLIQHLMAEDGFIEDVPSPTFTLVQTYEAGGQEIWHADLYRLTSPDEAAELGLEEAFGTALCLVEWPERLGSLLPPHALRLAFAADAGEGRIVTLSAGDPRWPARLASLLPQGTEAPLGTDAPAGTEAPPDTEALPGTEDGEPR